MMGIWFVLFRRRIVAIFGLFLLIQTGMSRRIQAQESPGQKPFERVCSTCHGADAKGQVGPALVPLDSDYLELRGIVREGRGQMPAISPEDLTDDELMDIVAYLKKLSEPAGTAGSSPSRATQRVEDRRISCRPGTPRCVLRHRPG